MKEIKEVNYKNAKIALDCCKISEDVFKEKVNELSLIEQKLVVLAIIDNKYAFVDVDETNQTNIDVEKLLNMDEKLKKIATLTVEDLNVSNTDYYSNELYLLTEDGEKLHYDGDIFEKHLTVFDDTEIKNVKICDLTNEVFIVGHKVKTIIRKSKTNPIRKGTQGIITDINIDDKKIIVDFDGLTLTYNDKDLINIPKNMLYLTSILI
jgi:hypothetical protein